jgi:restriction endonuclease Mrr
VVYIHRKYRNRQKSSVRVLGDIPNAKSKFLPDKSDRPQVIYADQLQNDTSINQPRDTKQVRNLNHCETKKRKVTSHQHNVADEILQVIDMVDTHEFVQEIVHTKQRVPSIICYTNEHLQDMKNCTTSKSGKLGIDRTFNVGQFYVTTIVF